MNSPQRHRGHEESNERERAETSVNAANDFSVLARSRRFSLARARYFSSCPLCLCGEIPNSVLIDFSHFDSPPFASQFVEVDFFYAFLLDQLEPVLIQ